MTLMSEQQAYERGFKDGWRARGEDPEAEAKAAFRVADDKARREMDEVKRRCDLGAMASGIAHIGPWWCSKCKEMFSHGRPGECAAGHYACPAVVTP